MKFRFKTKEDQTARVVASTEEAALLPTVGTTNANSTIGSSVSSESSVSTAATTADHRPWFVKVLSLIGTLISGTVLICGQMFMISGAAVNCGTLCSSIFGLSFDRVMYHCGPQDTYVGVLILAAVPIFWYAWYARFARLAVLILLSALFIGVLALSGISLQFAVTAVVTIALLCGFHFAGSFFASHKNKWPRKFSVTRWLSVCYFPAALLLAYEFFVLDLGQQAIDKVTTETVLAGAGIIAAFSFLPALLTAIDCRSRQFASGFGLSAIGQSPVVFSMLIYATTNALMLLWVTVSGTNAVADHFAWQTQIGMDPDFDHQTTYTEVLGKLLSSLLMCAILVGSIWSGSQLGVLWNRWRHRE